MVSVAMGEMSHARDLLALLLASSPATSLTGAKDAADANPATTLPPQTLKTTTISKLPDIPSVQAFNAQLIVGGKDEALRKAASALKSASESISRSAVRNAKYWTEALEIRRRNWALSPAPLPPGSPMGKGADRTTKDFLV